MFSFVGNIGSRFKYQDLQSEIRKEYLCYLIIRCVVSDCKSDTTAHLESFVEYCF